MKRVLFTCLSVLIFTGCKGLLFEAEKDPVYKEKTWNPVIEKFSSCGEIDTYLQEHKDNYGEAIPISAPQGSNMQDQPYSNQVDGILEGDILQVTSSYFFFASPEAIEVINRKDFSTYKSIPTTASGVRRLLAVDDKLIFIGSNYLQTMVQIFDAKSDFRKIYEKSFSGFLVDFRVIKEKLHIITQYYYQSSRENTDCAQIYRPNHEDGYALITFANQVNLGALPFSAVTTGFMGQIDFIHVTAEELLLFRNGYTLPSHFRVVKFGEGKPELEQVQTYRGNIKDRWSVLVEDKTIIFAATAVTGRRNLRENKLFAYEKMRDLQYELASESEGFGVGEDIRAVRYFMDKAYVVTFQRIDPLFIFDIKDARNMKLLGFLESPGFSTQLRELASGIMFGLGSADGFKSFKVSLFDIFDPLQPRETQTLIWGESAQSSSYSEALSEPKALFISQEKNRILFPATIMDDYGMHHIMPFSGALVLDFRDGQIREVGRITHESMRDPNCRNDIQRAFETQGEIYSFSRFGAMKSSATSFATLAEVPFKNSQEECGKY